MGGTYPRARIDCPCHSRLSCDGLWVCAGLLSSQGAAMAALAAFNLSDTYKINTMYTYVLGEGVGALPLVLDAGGQHWLVGPRKCS